ncbi:hypothetical protein PJI16_04590 [Nitrospira sp. MA-1]|nr:hypothetical protein [Nitrospira sp. MA-1]
MKTQHQIIGFLLAVILVILPLSSALGVQHVLAGADLGGHAHSDFDLCDWVHIQTTGSLSFDVNSSWLCLSRSGDVVVQAPSCFNNQPVISSCSPRAPPQS